MTTDRIDTPSGKDMLKADAGPLALYVQDKFPEQVSTALNLIQDVRSMIEEVASDLLANVLNHVEDPFGSELLLALNAKVSGTEGLDQTVKDRLMAMIMHVLVKVVGSGIASALAVEVPAKKAAATEPKVNERPSRAPRSSAKAPDENELGLELIETCEQAIRAAVETYNAGLPDDEELDLAHYGASQNLPDDLKTYLRYAPCISVAASGHKTDVKIPLSGIEEVMALKKNRKAAAVALTRVFTGISYGSAMPFYAWSAGGFTKSDIGTGASDLSRLEMDFEGLKEEFLPGTQRKIGEVFGN
ncbi:hypothetical protein HOE67_02485 [Candidatus Peregrinibacteria bacterium]|nr:hypothetical protein [Candidatus Peregrinibacteria bacterium]MBT4055955.1 hypothetical protein [Candidatus Peregrinibacteria bacterium]